MELSLKRATALGVAQTRLSEGRSKKWEPDLYLLSVQVTPPNPHLGGKDAGRIDITYLTYSYKEEEKTGRRRRKIFEEGKYLFAEENKNGERKRGQYLERENIFFCGGEENQRKKRRTIFGEGKYVLAPLATGTLPKGILDFGTPAQETLASGVLAVGTLLEHWLLKN